MTIHWIRYLGNGDAVHAMTDSQIATIRKLTMSLLEGYMNIDKNWFFITVRPEKYINFINAKAI